MPHLDLQVTNELVSYAIRKIDIVRDKRCLGLAHRPRDAAHLRNSPFSNGTRSRQLPDGDLEDAADDKSRHSDMAKS